VKTTLRVARTPDKPVLLYDGDCRFCAMWIERWRQCAGDGVEFLPFQSPESALRFPELPRERLESAVHFIATDGSVSQGAAAVFQSIAGGNCIPLWLYRNAPGFGACSEFVYRRVANHRPALSWVTRLLWGRSVQASWYEHSRWLFLRLLGGVYGIAFLSLWVQVPGLIGRDGILPVANLLSAVAGSDFTPGVERFWQLPTLCWFSASDGFLQFQCAAGVLAALLLVLNIAPAWAALGSWLLYLSLASVSGVFLGYQWDVLLLETGLLAVLLAPWQLWPWRGELPVRPLSRWLLLWLLFRLMFSSGCVKLLSGDPLWRGLTALEFHFETQPLPTWIGWYAHQLPHWIQKLSVLGMFGIELIIPFFVFLPRRPRQLAFCLFALLQGLIALTGNYTFFNLLTVVLCVPLLDDATLRRWLPRRWRPGKEQALRQATPGFWARCQGGTVLVVGALLFLVSLPIFAGTLHWRWPRLAPLVFLDRLVSPLRSVNGYGLFAVMTEPRHEIVIEGSDDGVNWREYEFKYKPGDIRRRPAFVAPHQPRVDWQMWFAALGDVRGNPWFVNLCVRLLQGEPGVLALLERDPFPDKAPRYIRARLYEYHFTTPAERRATGAWWRRELKGEYCPQVSLQGS